MLPRSNLAEAVALARGLLVAAALAPRLPELARLARDLLASRLDALSRALGGRLPEGKTRFSASALAERRLDLAWSALRSWLSGLAGLEVRRQSRADAAALLPLLFPEETSLVRPPPQLAWAESEARIVLLEREGFAAPLCAAGGAPFLEAIADAHQAFGQALEAEEGGAFSSRRQSRTIDAFVLALHAYAGVVAAELSAGDAEAAALASVLLAPIEFATQEGDADPPAPPSRAAPFEPFDELFEETQAA